MHHLASASCSAGLTDTCPFSTLATVQHTQEKNMKHPTSPAFQPYVANVIVLVGREKKAGLVSFHVHLNRGPAGLH
eukprot:965573-Pelagomonas_calceolata.AAC.11